MRLTAHVKNLIGVILHEKGWSLYVSKGSMDCDSERIWKIVENNRQDSASFKRSSNEYQISLLEKLHDLYLDQSSDKKEKSQRFRSAVNLIGNLEPPHLEISLILTLYKDEVGYSIMLPHAQDQSNEMFLPYEDVQIFYYISNHQIPPTVQEILQPHKGCCGKGMLWWLKSASEEKNEHTYPYDGSIICEIRNCRNSDDTLDSHLIILKPIFEIMNSDSDLEFRLNLTLPSICLDPSTDVAYVANRLYFNHRKYVPITVEKYLSRRGHRSDFCNSLNSEWFYMLNYFNRKSLKRNKSFRKLSESWKYKVSPAVPVLPNILQDVQKSAKEIRRLSSQRIDETSIPEVASENKSHPECTSHVNDQVSHSLTVKDVKKEQNAEEPVIQNMSSSDPLQISMNYSNVPSSHSEPMPITEGLLPPLLSIYQAPKSPKGNLPKLHPLVGDSPRIHHSHIKLQDTGRIGSHGNYMPQLRKLSSNLLDSTSIPGKK